MLKMIKNQKGMTLVELLAVMVIVGIIAAISVPAIGSVITKSKEKAHQANIVALEEAARLFVAAEDVTTAKVCGYGAAKDGCTYDLVLLGYLDKKPVNPKSSTDYTTIEVNIDEGKYIVTLN